MLRFDLSYTDSGLRNFLVFPARLATKAWFVARVLWCAAWADRYTWVFRLPDGGSERMVRPNMFVLLERLLDEVQTTPGFTIINPGDEETPEWMVLDFTAAVKDGEWKVNFPDPDGDGMTETHA